MGEDVRKEEKRKERIRDLVVNLLGVDKKRRTFSSMEVKHCQ